MSKIPVDQRHEYPQDNTYWRSREQLAEAPEWKALAQREFANEASELIDPVSRRNFLQFMTASMGLAGLQACRRPVQQILPYTRTPEDVIPGVAQHYASSFSMGQHSFGLLVESHEGRPTKVEGNPDHSSSFGGTNAYAQALVLDLYDADRSQAVLNKGKKATWADFSAFAKTLPADGAGVAVLSETIASPTLAAQSKAFLAKYPKAIWAQYDPLNSDNALAGAKLAFGSAVRAHADYEKADVIAAFGADFLHEGESLAASRQWAKRRKPDSQMSRLYVVEGQFTVTGAAADHRVRVQTRQVFDVLRAVAAELTKAGLPVDPAVKDAVASAKFENEKFVKALAKDLLAKKGKAVIVVGDAQPAAAHALAHTLNLALAAPVTFTAVPDYQATEQAEQLKALVDSLGSVTTLIILGGNPAYNLPFDVKFEERVKKIANVVHLSDRVDETSALAGWHLPRSHAFEAWGDTISFTGQVAPVQPLIEPLYDTKSDIEVVSILNGNSDKRGYDLVRATYSDRLDAEAFWRRSVHAGVFAGTQLAAVTPTLTTKWTAALAAPPAKAELELQFVVGSIYDGRFANNSWLQESPDPMSKLVWDNAALLSAKTAAEMSVKNGSVIKISYKGQSLDAPVWVQPGQPDKTISIALGYGRSKVGLVGENVGVNAYKLRHSAAPWFDGSVTAAPVAGATYKLVSTQDHGSMEGRPVVRERNLPEFQRDPGFARKMVQHPKLQSLFKEHDYTKGHQWSLIVDLNSCVGCNNCAVACQAENNIPVVGKDQVSRGRYMTWIRLDRYFEGSEEEPHVVHQAVMCMHCENAPCEQVCPVGATIHSPEGLNDIAYNRCIGTKYCLNNCPYKVRRFNFLAWHETEPEKIKMQHNPNVTVRMRGVIEKCTYCVQRINAGKIKEKTSKVAMKDGDVTPACAQACPSGALTFGDLLDPNSRVAQLGKDPRNYGMLEELNTKPRTTYLAKVRNLNPELG